jgi:hypoxanthine phosphoribosyltransferase
MSDDGKHLRRTATGVPQRLRCELVSWAAAERLCERLAGRIRASDYRPERVIAIGRGGYVPARLLCDYLHLMDLTGIKVEHYLAGADRQKQAVIRYPLQADIRGMRVLLVDDVNDSGDTLEVAIRHLQSFEPAEIRSAVIDHKTVSRVAVDYHARQVVKWRWLIYPWALHEDLGGFLRRAEPVPATPAEAQTLLAERFSLDIPLRRLAAVYRFMNH